jgi:hypothetical protein
MCEVTIKIREFLEVPFIDPHAGFIPQRSLCGV